MLPASLIPRLFIFLILFVLPASLLADPTVELRHVRTLDNDFAVTVLAWHPDGRHLAVGQVLNKRIAIWDTREYKLLRTLENESGGVQTLVYSPNGKYLAVGRSGTRVSRDHAHTHVYEATTGNLFQKFMPPSIPPSGDSNDTYAIAFSPDSHHLAAAGYGSVANVVVYDVVSGKLFGRLPDESKSRSRGIRIGSVEALAFSRDGHFLAIGRNLGELEVWSVQPWDLLKRLDGQSGGVRALAFTPDGKYLASGTNVGERWDRKVKPSSQMFGNFPDDIVLWSVPVFEKAREFKSRHFKHTPNSSIIERLQFSPDGKLLLVSARARSLEIIDVTTGQTALFRDGFGAVVHAALSPDGKQLALGLGRKIEIHELSFR